MSEWINIQKTNHFPDPGQKVFFFGGGNIHFGQYSFSCGWRSIAYHRDCGNAIEIIYEITHWLSVFIPFNEEFILDPKTKEVVDSIKEEFKKVNFAEGEKEYHALLSISIL